MTSGVDWALAWHRETTGRAAVARPLSSGVQSNVFLIDGSPASEPLVLKEFNHEYGFNSPQAVRVEAGALRLLSDRLDGADGVACPRVVAEAPDSWSYLMTFCRGRPVIDARPDAGDMARRLLAVLDHYYEAVLAPYCDFQPKNVLIGDDALYVFDPTLPNPLFDELIGTRDRVRWAGADVGFWLHAVSAQAARTPHHVGALRWLRGASVELAAAAAEHAAPDDTGPFVEDAFAVARFHARRFATLSRASRIVLPYKLLQLAALERSVGARLARPARSPTSQQP